MTKFNLDKAETDYKPYRNKGESREVNLKRAVLLSKLAQAQKDYDAAVRRLNSMTGQPSEMELRKAESDLELAQANLLAAQRKYETLQKGPDPQDVKVAEERLGNAKKQMEAAESALSDLELRAPFGGTVSEVHVRSNEWVSPGQVVIVLADLSHLRVETTDLNEIDVARVQVGDQAIITFDALPEARVSGRVTRIAPRSSQGSGVNYRVIIELQEIPAGLRWGMTAFVDIVVSR
jgi:HlyD family secretion protein